MAPLVLRASSQRLYQVDQPRPARISAAGRSREATQRAAWKTRMHKQTWRGLATTRLRA